MRFGRMILLGLLGCTLLNGCGMQFSDFTGGVNPVSTGADNRADNGIDNKADKRSGNDANNGLDNGTDNGANNGNLSQITNAYVVPEYSEIKSNLDTDKYFAALSNDKNQYFIVEDGDDKYLLAQFVFYGYGSEINTINGVEKQYDGNELTITIDGEIGYFENMGCEPNISRYNCSFVLEKDVSNVKIGLRDMEKEYEPYAGGIIQIDGKFGVVDASLNEIVPAEYDSIMNWGYVPEGTTFYKTVKDGANGLMDENFNVVLSNSYSNIVIVSEHKFLAMRNYSEADKNYEILLLDENENETGQSIMGFLDAYTTFNNYGHQIVFGRFDGDKYYEGVIDENLNIIIEPVYKDVVMFEDRSEKQFYVVENKDGEFAVFDYTGKQRTEYVNSSVYDVKEAYER